MMSKFRLSLDKILPLQSCCLLRVYSVLISDLIGPTKDGEGEDP